MNNIVRNYQQLQQQIKSIIIQNNINYPIKLIAVSKTFPSQDIIELHSKTRHLEFGENYVQELHQKALDLSDYPLQWHFIGSIQSNKIKYIARHSSWVHSLSNAKHTLRLNQERPTEFTKLNILIEVNISCDSGKHGVTNFEEILELAAIINSQENLVLRGLMGMSGTHADLKTKNQQFAQLKHLFDQLKSTSSFESIDTLSMGMSDDFELAIKNGANMLRIGSLIFGKRAEKY